MNWGQGHFCCLLLFVAFLLLLFVGFFFYKYKNETHIFYSSENELLLSLRLNINNLLVELSLKIKVGTLFSLNLMGSIAKTTLKENFRLLVQ